MSTPYEKDIPAHAEDIDTEKGSVANMKPRTGDMALALVGNERIDLTQEDNDRIRRKTDKYILSMLIWVYFLQILDKSVLGVGNVWGLSTDTHLVGTQYNSVSIISAAAQLCWMPMSSYLIVRVPSRHLMAILCFGWGAAQACMAACTNFSGLMACRFFLGLFEAGCLPLFSILTAQWYRRSEQPVRVAAWYSTNGLATIAAAFLSWALGHIKSDHIHAWQIIFMVVGCITCISAPIVWWIIDSDIPTARFLDEHEKAQAVERLRANQTGTGSHEFKWQQVYEVFYDPKSYLWVAMSLLLNVGASVSNALGPTLIKGMGFDTYVTTLLNMPFGVLQFICILAASYAAQAWRIKSGVLAIFVVPVVVGLALLYSEGLKGDAYKQGPALAGYYLLSFLFGCNPLIVSWMISCTAGQTKKSVIMSLYNAGSSAGNIIGPMLFPSSQSPHYVPGIRTVLAIFCALLAVVGIQVVVLHALNKVRQNQRVKNGKPRFIKDTSMESKYVAFGEGNEDTADAAPTAEGEAPVARVMLGQNALLDLTDYENDEMIYTY